MSKFNPKTFKGTNIILQRVLGSTGISKLYEWNYDKHIYEVPFDKKVYRARKTIIIHGKKSRPSEYFESLDDAKKWLQCVDFSIAKLDGPQDTSPQFQEVLKSWKIACYNQLADGTKVRYDRMIGSTLGFFLNIEMCQFTKALITKWIEELKSTPYTSRRLRFKHELKLLHSILKYYADSTDHFIMPITTFHKKMVDLRPKRTRNQNLTKLDFEKFVHEVRKLKDGEVLSRMATVQYYQALRISEVAALSKNDITLDPLNPHESHLTISRSLQYLRKKGVQPILQDCFKNSKSSGVKELPIFPESYEPLTESLSQSQSEFLFLDSTGEFFTYRTLQQRYDLAFKRAGLPYQGTHVLRHGGTRNLYNLYPDLAVAGQLLGNDDLATVSVYAKRDKRALFNISKELWGKRKISEDGR